MGGEVFQMNGTYRVNGNLAVSRAIGNAFNVEFIDIYQFLVYSGFPIIQTKQRNNDFSFIFRRCG